MSGEKKTILAWGTTDQDKEVGIPEKYVKILEKQFDIVWQPDVEYNNALGRKVEGAILTGGRAVDIMYRRPELFPNLRVVVSMSDGLDHVDPQALHRRRIRLAATASFTDAVAEMTITLLLWASRDIALLTAESKEPLVRKSRLLWDAPGILGSTVGFVGFGRIGVRTAELLKPHRCRIIYYDPYKKSSEDSDGCAATRYIDLQRMLPECDSVIVACALTDTTTGLIGERQFSAMKSSAIFINVARGKIVDTEAMTRALRTRTIRAAGLDVTEPVWLPPDHPLLHMDNVLITPHCAAITDSSVNFAFKDLINNLVIGLRGDTMPKEVNLY